MAPAGKSLHLWTVIWLAVFPSVGQAQLPTDNPMEMPAGEFTCGQPATLISVVQGTGRSSPLIGREVEVEAVVVGAFQDSGELGGLFVQEEDSDRDRDDRTSEGLFVLTGFHALAGDIVRLRGRVTEFKGLTELHPVSQLLVCSNAAALPTPALLELPVPSAGDLEAIEGMRVALPQTLVITDLHLLWRFGEIVVSSKRLAQPTQFATPGKPAGELARANARDRLIIDDGRTGRNLPVSMNGRDNATPFDATNSVRTGQRISNLEGVMHFGFGDYRLQPTRALTIEGASNSRSAAPDPVGGTIRVAEFNVFNFFSTPNQTGAACGPARRRDCRGARNALEQTLQLQKLSAALSGIGADIVALIELENNPDQSLRDITQALNARAGDEAWSYVNTGIIGPDVIKVGLIYRPRTAVTEGRFALLDHTVDGRFDDTLNRPALAQTFRVAGSDELFTVIAAHLKSKSCINANGPQSNRGDGQSCFNGTRAEAAAALASWGASDPTGGGTGRVLVMGDFNSYRMEDPIRLLHQGNLIDLLAQFDLDHEYTFVFEGMTGTLDYAFGSPALARQVTGVAVWHINADEPGALDYRQDPAKPRQYYASGPFRSSDHDPVIVGLDFAPAPSGAAATGEKEGLPNLRYLAIAFVLVLLALGVRVLRVRQADTMRRSKLFLKDFYGRDQQQGGAEG